MVNMDNISNFVKHELLRVLPRHAIRVHKKYIAIRCPFHNERTPSCGVNLDPSKTAVGVFNCFGCGEKGGWNILAEKIGAELIEEESIAEQDPFYALTGTLKTLEVSKNEISLPKGCEEWKGKWRGIGEKLLIAMGAKKWWDRQSNIYRMIIPVEFNGRLNGWVASYIEEKIEPGHRNMDGTWVKTTWYGYSESDLVQKIWSKYNHKCVAIVEGPGDCLRCLFYRIPTLALLGTNNWSEEKLNALVSLGVENVVLFLDNDEAGKKARNVIYPQIKNIFNTKVVRYEVSDKGVDPGNCSLEYFEQIHEFFRSVN